MLPHVRCSIATRDLVTTVGDSIDMQSLSIITGSSKEAMIPLTYTALPNFKTTQNKRKPTIGHGFSDAVREC